MWPLSEIWPQHDIGVYPDAPRLLPFEGWDEMGLQTDKARGPMGRLQIHDSVRFLAMIFRAGSTKVRLEDVLFDCEQSLTDPETRASRELVEALLHEDFVETGSSGEVYDRASMIEMMVGESPGEVFIRDFEVQALAEDIMLASYRSVGTSGQEARRTSIWVNDGGRWRLRHHQGTRVPNSWGRIS